MKTKEESLSPTLWRTCRVLANPNRVRCLKAVLKCPGRSVEDVAAAVGLTEVKASLALRALQSRGQSADVKEGIASFMDKRDPHFPNGVGHDFPADLFAPEPEFK